ncbi:unnamed protein product [Rodentolepis nana]|uniref:Uncharacterized protein n=1 Tax=Rodentolepis nana TaxID=102285 RepID=A0A0R3TSV5_RODNA|nr:unnamed protein product [Rodentolepis nana]
MWISSPADAEMVQLTKGLYSCNVLFNDLKIPIGLPCVLSGDLSFFGNPVVSTGLLTRDDSILASSILLARNSFLNHPSRSEAVIPNSNSSTPVAQIYSQFQNYCNLSENGTRNPFLPPLFLQHNMSSNPPMGTTAPDTFPTQLPNLAASFLRSRSGSLSRRASESDLQKFVPPNTAPFTENGATIQLDCAQEELLRTLRNKALVSKNPDPLSTQSTSQAELYRSIGMDFESSMFGLGGDSESKVNPNNPPIVMKH